MYKCICISGSMYVYATYIQMHKCTCVCMVTQLISTQQCVPAIYVFPPLAGSVSLPPSLSPSLPPSLPPCRSLSLPPFLPPLPSSSLCRCVITRFYSRNTTSATKISSAHAVNSRCSTAFSRNYRSVLPKIRLQSEGKRCTHDHLFESYFKLCNENV